MTRWIIIAILTVGLAGTAFWGYQEQQDKNALLTQAENTYQREFHELSYYMDIMHDELGTALAMNSGNQISPKLVDIWRLTSEASSNVGHLPLGLMPFNKTEEFLSEIGDFTYRTAVRDLENEPLSQEEEDTLNELYEQSGEIKDELRNVQHKTLENGLSLMDVELALANEGGPADNSIIDGLETVNDSAGQFSESNANSGMIGTSPKQHEYRGLNGEEIDESGALEKGKEIFDVSNEDNLIVTESGDGVEEPFYSVSYDNGDNHAYMDVSKRGGHPLTLLIDRPIGEKQVSLNQGLEEAQNFLDEHEFPEMELFQSLEYNNTGFYSFLSTQDSVRIYPDAVEIKVALDNGGIIGFTAENYFLNHTQRDIPEPEISVEEAKEEVNPNVEIQEEFLAIIENDLGEEVLTHEFLGILGNDTFRIFINAMDGGEEKIERLNNKEIKM